MADTPFMNRGQTLRDIVAKITKARTAALALAVSLAAEIDALDAVAETAQQAISARFEYASNTITTKILSEELEHLTLALRRRFEEIADDITIWTARKRAALEAEQVAVDAALEQAADASAAIDAISGEAPDAILADRPAAQHAQLIRVAAVLAALPSRPLEPIDMRLEDASGINVVDLPTLQRLLASLGHLVVVRGAQAKDVALSPPPRFVRPGRALHVSLSLAPSWGPLLPSDDVPATLTQLAAHVSGHLVTLDGSPLNVPLSVTPDPAARLSLTLTFPLPPTIPLGTQLSLAICVGAVAIPPPVDCITISCGVRAGLQITAIPSATPDDDYRCPVALHSGILCVPRASGDDDGDVVSVVCDAFDAEGAPLPSPPIDLFAVESMQAMTAAEVGNWWPAGLQPPSGSMIVICRATTRNLKLCAADEADVFFVEMEDTAKRDTPARPLWCASLAHGQTSCVGLAALSRAGVVIVGACSRDGFLAVHSLATGEPIARSSPLFHAANIAADDSCFCANPCAVGAGSRSRPADVFVSAREALYRRSGDVGTFRVYHFRWYGAELTLQVRRRDHGEGISQIVAPPPSPPFSIRDS